MFDEEEIKKVMEMIKSEKALKEIKGDIVKHFIERLRHLVETNGKPDVKFGNFLGVQLPGLIDTYILYNVYGNEIIIEGIYQPL